MALVVVTGGARSGKSAAATRLAERLHGEGADVTVVVFGSADDAEMSERIARHQAERPSGFVTLEACDSRSWMAEVDPSAVLLVDCIGTLVGRVMGESWPADAATFADAPAEVLPEGYAERVESACTAAASWVATRTAPTIVVTNEVGEGIVPSYATGRLFRDVMGRFNRTLISHADAAFLAVAGKLLDLSALPTEIAWPSD